MFRPLPTPVQSGSALTPPPSAVSTTPSPPTGGGVVVATDAASSPASAFDGAVATVGGASEKPSFIKGLLDSNPFFSAGAGLMIFTASLAIGRQALGRGAHLAQRRLLVTLDIPSHDHAYPWFLEWMGKQAAEAGLASGKVTAPAAEGAGLPVEAPTGWFKRLLELRGLKSHELSVETAYKKRENGSSEAVFSLIPGPGKHYFKYQGAWMQLNRERSGKQISLTTGTPWETLTLTTLSRDRDLFPQLLAEARQLALAKDEGKTVVYTRNASGWAPFGKPRRKRKVGSVILDEGVGEAIEGDLRRFLHRESWYSDRGIPYRRGYLLHGPPGSGKTSYIQALAGAIDYDICFLNLSERGLSDDSLQRALTLVPERCIVLLEDIDAAFSRRVQTEADGYQSGVTFSGLLNTLDGVASADSRIIFMTTNHLSQLDPALIRPGRVDNVHYIGDASPFQASALFRKFYTEEAKDEADLADAAGVVARFVETMEGKGWAISMAALQGHFIRSGMESAIEGLTTLFQERATPIDPAKPKEKDFGSSE